VYDASHVVMVEPIDNDMFAMMLPLYQYSNVVYSPHGYSTLMITHQGVPGESQANVRNKYPTLTSTSNLTAPFGITQLSKQHDDVRTMSHRFNVPVFVGEFSCVNWSPVNDAGKWTSTEWNNDNITLLEQEKWSWCYHAWRGDWPAWEAEIPSSYYNTFTFSNAAPQGLPSYSTWVSNRSNTAPTITMLEGWFGLNNTINYDTTIAVLQALTMTKDGTLGTAQQNLWLQDSTGEVFQNVTFPYSVNYRFDFTGHGSKANTTWPNLAIKIDNVTQANIVINDNNSSIWTAIIKVSAGTHKVAMRFTNDNGSSSFKLSMGLLYITPDILPNSNAPVRYPAINKLQTFPVFGSRFLNPNDFTSGHLRGSNYNRDNQPNPRSDLTVFENYGANLLRLFIELHSDGTSYSFVADELDTADAIIHQAYLHHFYVNLVVTEDDQNETFWGSTSLKNSYAQRIGEVAARYKDSTEVADIALANEPGMVGNLGEWANFSQKLANSIRRQDTNHIIVMPSGVGNQDIFRLTEPLPFKNMVYEYHSYFPFQITHQGINANDSERTEYPNTPTTPGYDATYIGAIGKSDISLDLQLQRDFSAKFNAPIYIGEFSCVNYAPNYSNCRYIADVIDLFEIEGWTWTFHAFRQYEAWDAEISNRWYNGLTFTNASPNVPGGFQTLDAHRSDTTCAIKTMINYWSLNNKVQVVTDTTVKAGVWGIGNLNSNTSVTQLNPYSIRGFHIYFQWDSLETARKVFNWNYFDSKIQLAYNNGLTNVSIMVLVSPYLDNTPKWLTSVYGVPEVITNGTNGDTYPYYFHAAFKASYWEMIDSVSAHVATLSSSLKNIVKSWQSAEGKTGDEDAYQGTPTNPAYVIADTAWDTWKHLIWDSLAIHNSAIKGVSSSGLRLMFNTGNNGQNFDYVKTKFPFSFGKEGQLSHSYAFDGDFDYFNRRGLFTRGEIQDVFTNPLFRYRPETYQIVISSIAGGLNIFNIGSGYLLKDKASFETVPDPKITDYFNIYSNLTASKSNIGFIGLRDVIDFTDTVRFPVSVFGVLVDPAQLTTYNSQIAAENASSDGATYKTYRNLKILINRFNQSRKNSIITSNLQAKYDTTTSWTDDFGYKVVKNYEEFIKQVNPNTTSIGVYRIGGDTAMHARFARSPVLLNGTTEMYFDINDTLANNLFVNQVVHFDVSYYDSSNTIWSLNYFTCKGKTESVIQNTNTRKWKKFSVDIDNFQFGNNLQNSSDFTIKKLNGTVAPIIDLIEFKNLSKQGSQ
jgi:endoglucanase